VFVGFQGGPGCNFEKVVELFFVGGGGEVEVAAFEVLFVFVDFKLEEEFGLSFSVIFFGEGEVVEEHVPSDTQDGVVF
jgi:hypothetical protein